MVSLTVETNRKLSGDTKAVASDAVEVYPDKVIPPISQVHVFNGNDPWHNLAREECWHEVSPAGSCVLFLYVNSPCVVMGKHQNPLREVNLEQLLSRGLPLLRRSTGGGTVWHDEGNLNWSFLLPKEGYNREHVTLAVAEALSPLGFALSPGEKGDLFLGDRKVSGAAYQFRRDQVTHHGTLLCRARLGDLRGVLGATGTLTQWIGVASRPMPVTNLEITVASAVDALVRGLGPVGTEHGNGHGDLDFEAKVAARAIELKSETWVWDTTPPFTWEGQSKMGWVRVQVRDGRIEQAWDDRTQIMSKILGKRFFGPEFWDSISTREVV